MELHQQLQKEILIRGIKQKFIAEQIGVKQNKFNKMLSGETRITAKDFIKICKVLGIKTTEFKI